jgi:Fe/S biogenesis protein NfuA
MVKFTDKARERIIEFLESDPAADLAVRVRVRNPSPVNPEYEMTLIEAHERGPEDELYPGEGFDVVVDSESARILEGTTVDWVESLQGSGFQFDNPGIKPLGSEPLAGPMAERVQRVLSERINPSVAMHGGGISLVDIRDNVVYVSMSGGCQGCGMASVTLTQGIKQVLHDAVPEIVDVQDVTDHTAGQNPYFAPSK